MSIEAGFQGTEFNPLVLHKIAQLSEPARGLDIELIVDGGVNLNNIGAIAKNGADSVAVGSALWKSSDISETIAQLAAEDR
jgi:ribulose-phosphate 3-epimerase